MQKLGLERRALGDTLTVIYSAETSAPRRQARHNVAMPLLVILFLVSYVILTMLVFEQGQTIESQRGLIREMLKDSTQLAAIKDKMAQEKTAAATQQKSAVAPAPAPAPGTKTSDNKVAKPSGKSARTTHQVPGKPAADLEDVRRSTRVI